MNNLELKIIDPLEHKEKILLLLKQLNPDRNTKYLNDTLVAMVKQPNYTYNLKPNDLPDYISIINADKQYSPVSDGRINNQISKEKINRMKETWLTAADDNNYKQYLIDNSIPEEDISKLMNITGFRRFDAPEDASQNINTYRFKDHI